MGRRTRSEFYFGKRLKAERERRGWSQAEMAKMLSERGVQPMHPTTIAKMESTDPATRRAVKIDEAIGIADLFGMSLDALLGRTSGLQSDLAYTVRALLDYAQQASHQTWGIATALRARYEDVAALEFDGRETLRADVARAWDALVAANTALAQIAIFALPPEAALGSVDPEAARSRAELMDLYRAVAERDPLHGEDTDDTQS